MKNAILKKFELPNYEKLKTYLNTTHPRYLDHEKKTKNIYTCWTTCKFNTGENCFCGTSEKPTDVDQYGPAMMLYFRFLKTTIFFILACAILNSVLVYLYSEAYAQGKSEDTSSLQDDNFILAMRDWSLTGSLGGYSYGSTRFYEANFSSPSVLNSTMNNLTSSDPNTIVLECPKGQIDINQKYTYYGLILRDFPSAYTFFMFEKAFNNESAFYKSLANCTGKGNCTISYDSSWFAASAVDYIEGTNGKVRHKLYLKYHCANIRLSYFNQFYSKSDLNYVIIVINFLILGFFLVYLICWSYYEKKIFRDYVSKMPHPSDYTLKIKNLPQHWNEETLAQNLHLHLMHYAKSMKISGEPIVDINVAKNNSILHLDQLIRKYEIKATGIVQKLLDDQVIENPPQGTPLDIKYLLEYRLLNPDKFKEPKVEKELKEFMDMIKKKQVYEVKREKSATQKETFQSVFVTFNTNLNAVRFFNAMNISKSKRMSLNCLSGKKGHINKFANKIVRVKKAPEPINIEWENLQVSPFEKKVRRVVSWVSTILLIGIPIIVVTLISLNIKRNEPLKFSCPNNSVFSAKNQELSTKEKSILINDFKSKDSENLMFCYCYADFKKRLAT